VSLKQHAAQWSESISSSASSEGIQSKYPIYGKLIQLLSYNVALSGIAEFGPEIKAGRYMSEQNEETRSQSLPTQSDGRVELACAAEIDQSPLYNEDLAPIPIARRTWSTYSFAALWAGMACNIPTYMMASGLITKGMNWWQALLCIFLGNAIVLVPIVLNSHAGTKYGIPFPVLARASYGVVGSNVPALMRAIIACGWFGINAWIGGQAVFTLFKTFVPNFQSLLGATTYGDHTITEWFSFAIFWLLNISVIFRGMEVVKKLESWAAPFIFSMTGLLVIWTVSKANGFGSLMSETGKFHTLDSFLPVFVPSVTAMIGSWSTLSLNMPDFTRFGRSQREQITGQAAALPASMTAFSAMGIMITSAGALLYPHMNKDELWDPVKLIGQFQELWVVALAMFTVILATLSVNIAANVVSPANDFANAFPRWISFKRGALLTGIIALLMQPWKLMADPDAYIFTWLLGYAGGLGSIGGVLIVDYWLVRKKTLNLADLYLMKGEYTYTNGWNIKALVATGIACAFAWIGAFVAPLHFLYDYSWFVGIAIASVTYYVMMVPFRGTKNSS
jgi:NCS1 family nucleobase:cation symporter-1